MQLVGLVAKVSASHVVDLGSIPAFDADLFSRWSPSCDLEL